MLYGGKFDMAMALSLTKYKINLDLMKYIDQ
jgi:hypothetical protein